MNNNSSMIGIVGICIVACILFACAGAWATTTLNNAADNASSALAAAVGDDTEQSARAVCVAGLVNLDSCNTSQTQTRTETPAAAWDDGDDISPLAWSLLAILGLGVLCFSAVLASSLEVRR